jgi:hypothetical protein
MNESQGAFEWPSAPPEPPKCAPQPILSRVDASPEPSTGRSTSGLSGEWSSGTPGIGFELCLNGCAVCAPIWAERKKR